MSDKMKVLAVLHADVQATRGSGNKVALVTGAGKADKIVRLYGQTALVRAELLDARFEGQSMTPDKLAQTLKVPIIKGKVAGEKFMSDKGLSFDGSEKIVADAGKSGNKKGGFGKSYNYSF